MRAKFAAALGIVRYMDLFEVIRITGDGTGALGPQ